VSWRAALEDLLRVGYGAQAQSRFVDGAWQQIRWRTTPSAGALYPFEVVASVVGEGNYVWDVDAGRLVPSDLAPLTRDELARAGFVCPPDHRLEALLVLVARPWLSMKKYRLRGYAYTHLDVGHTTTNLAMYTAALGLAPTLHLRFSRALLVEHLKLEGLCREPMAALSFAKPEGAVAAPAGWLASENGHTLAGLELPGPPEMVNWESLKGILSFDSPLAPPCKPSRVSLVLDPGEAAAGVSPLPDGRPPLAAPAEWRSAILGRRSAKGFSAAPLTVAQVGELLGVLRAEGVPDDCSAEGATRLGVRVVAKNVDGLSSGVYSYAPGSHALHCVDPQTDDHLPACMQQEVSRDVAALVIFHAPLYRLIDERGYSAFAELLFHASQLGHRLHLAAARLAGVGITCIGGFDSERCHTLARLDGEDEAVYVLLLGVPDDNAVKRDRLNVAWSHGFTTAEG
jgi:SagB-type dehydrogenase family enzyme